MKTDVQVDKSLGYVIWIVESISVDVHDLSGIDMNAKCFSCFKF